MLKREITETAINSGASLVGIVSAQTIDSFPRTWVGWTVQDYTKKTDEILPEIRSVVVIGYYVWDDMLELAIRKGENWVYPGYFPLDILTLKVKENLQSEGFDAAYAHSISLKRLAQLAGFGNYGKNSLIINPTYGPWIRLAAVLTNAELEADTPFTQDLCGKCEQCLEVCPVGALAPFEVDDKKCLVGINLANSNKLKVQNELAKHEPVLSRNSHLMCMQCQKACKYGNRQR
ncbi:MAG: epoxyqueuosine reductase [Candidatus Bathyarchaeota archaeon]|nr:MAG: epoxyqueuosine reductase [Candidatus Bathyarchaeota archaeon]